MAARKPIRNIAVQLGLGTCRAGLEYPDASHPGRAARWLGQRTGAVLKRDDSTSQPDYYRVCSMTRSELLQYVFDVTFNGTFRNPHGMGNLLV